ncbi:Self-incomp_S1 domain-containing protein, partial [Cephalotus follicularis]
ILFLILLFCFLFLGEGRIYVSIMNFMQSNVTLHCKSRNDDLEEHALSHGNSYEWSFYVNFWKTTLFFCTFTSQHGRGVYDIFKAHRDDMRCSSLCLWEVKDDGV